MQPSAFQYSECHPNCCHSVHQVILTECTVILTTWLSILPILFVNNNTRTFHSDGTDVFIDINTYFWEMNLRFWVSYRLLQVIHYVVLYVRIVLRNAHTSLQILRMIREMYQSDWKKNCITGFCRIVLTLSHQCVKLCCSVCVFEGLCVMSESKVRVFSKIELFWVKSFILTWI